MNVKTSLLTAVIGQIIVGAWLGALGAPALAQQKPVVGIDRVVAVVNNQVITASQLTKRVEMVTRQVGPTAVQLPPPDVLEKQVLERLIIERVQEQKAAELGIRVDDGQLAMAIASVVIKATPAARPSSPSIKLTALVIATIQRTVMGKDRRSNSRLAPPNGCVSDSIRNPHCQT